MKIIQSQRSQIQGSNSARSTLKLEPANVDPIFSFEQSRIKGPWEASGEVCMVEIGYKLSSEEHPPNELVAQAVRAEECEFSFAIIPITFTRGSMRKDRARLYGQ